MGIAQLLLGRCDLSNFLLYWCTVYVVIQSQTKYFELLAQQLNALFCRRRAGCSDEAQVSVPFSSTFLHFHEQIRSCIFYCEWRFIHQMIQKIAHLASWIAISSFTWAGMLNLWSITIQKISIQWFWDIAETYGTQPYPDIIWLCGH